ncbi:TPA: TMAO reductase system periplasmic protein TorT [Escherichia coli]|uniref:TMAO reductase system periplasmic protein TorT n=1 Tax=Escherichia TaxID=561 RepID=UPI000D339899|nr:TMAO reductase system periplasmic protein TorT [Escherichia coli]EJC5120450.1 TMAO reductase system periplasmic protein TorT [Escherichia coli]EJF3543969.1 TMAO reductase system periplasmic protein TorT [Escherichia coli]MBW7409612.1 TMAO reductase system periplasmic protein TorT [Escherichia coli]MCK2319878.1 TMAO reductase system periplasmic protein TorT [Escherichia coli]MDD8612969.1 TMAO reductase system periplasmic protein TorT [Escherichia coli]
MRVLLFLLLSLFMLPAFSADNLLRWHDAQHFTVQASTPLKAKRAWKLCALYPSLKDSYWLSLNYGMQEAARRYGVDLKVLEAGGYSQLATQQAQIDQCKQWGAEAILLGSSTTSFPDLQKQVASLPVIELVNAIDAPQVKSRVGVPWFQMGYQPGRYLVQWAHGKPLNVLLMPGPDNAGGSKEIVEGFRAAIAGSPVRIVDIALGDNDIEIQRNLLQEMLERHPEIDVVAGTAIAAEAAMGEGRNLKTPLTVVSFYLSHQVYRGLKRGRVIMAVSDQMVWQGELAVEQAIRQLQGQSVSDNVSPPILVLTPKNADREHIRRSLSPGGFRPVYFYQHTSAAKK